MKTKVIEFFQNLPEAKHEQFNKAFELYRQSELKNAVTERVLNATGFTPSSLDNLLYDLQKIHGITDVEKVPSVQVAVSSERLEELEVNLSDEGDGILLLDINYEIPGTQEETVEVGSEKLEVGSTELIPVSTEATAATTEPTPDVSAEELDSLKEENEELKSDNEDLEFDKEQLEEEVEELKAEVETLKLAPKLDAKQIRVEFPFLNDKNCPDEFKILMADKITAWNRYLECQEMIVKIETGEVVETDIRTADLAKNAIEAFDENQKIYDELVAYQETGKILGLHPVFKRLQLTREVETMTPDELHKYKGSSAKYFTDNRKSLAKAEEAKDEARIIEINTRVEERSQKLALVNKKLGIPVK